MAPEEHALEVRVDGLLAEDHEDQHLEPQAHLLVSSLFVSSLRLPVRYAALLALGPGGQWAAGRGSAEAAGGKGKAGEHSPA